MMAGKLLSTAVTERTWHAQPVFDNCASSLCSNPNFLSVHELMMVYKRSTKEGMETFKHVKELYGFGNSSACVT